MGRSVMLKRQKKRDNLAEADWLNEVMPNSKFLSWGVGVRTPGG